MDSNDTALLAVIAKKLRELRADFVGLSKQPGPAGRDGKDGADGVGTAGRDGLDGKVGERGPAGPRGPVGTPGKDGIDGADGERGPMPDHQWKGTQLRFQKPDGGWGKYTDLKGERGPAGATGVAIGGSGGWSPNGLPAASGDTPDGFLVRQGGTWAVATYDQMATWLGGSGPVITDAVLTEDGDMLVTESGDNIVQE